MLERLRPCPVCFERLALCWFLAILMVLSLREAAPRNQDEGVWHA